MSSTNKILVGVGVGSAVDSAVGSAARKVCFRRFPSVGRRNPTKKPPHFRQFPTDPSETVGSREIRPHWKYFRQKPSETIGNRRKWVGSYPLPSETVGNCRKPSEILFSIPIFFRICGKDRKPYFFFNLFALKSDPTFFSIFLH